MNLLHVVAKTCRKRAAQRTVGTIVEQLAPQVYEVEFKWSDGKTHATAAVSEKLLIPQEGA